MAARASTLLVAVSLAFVWVCLTGEFEARWTPVKREGHGDAQGSVFRLGLDSLQNLLLHPSPASWGSMDSTMPRFVGESAVGLS